MARRRPSLPVMVRMGRRLPGPLRGRLYLLLVTVMVLAVILVRWVTATHTSGYDVSRYQHRIAGVVAVIDGDTIDINIPDGDHPTTRIRLWGVDTPETAHGDTPAMHWGDQAASFSRQILLHKQVMVVLLPQRTRDRYGRLLAYIYTSLPAGIPACLPDDTDVTPFKPTQSHNQTSDQADAAPGSFGVLFNEYLVRWGHAYADQRFDHPYRRQFSQAERRAEKQNLGLWAEVTEDDMPDWRIRWLEFLRSTE